MINISTVYVIPFEWNLKRFIYNTYINLKMVFVIRLKSAFQYNKTVLDS